MNSEPVGKENQETQCDVKMKEIVISTPMPTPTIIKQANENIMTGETKMVMMDKKTY